jgi:2-polyprenyl-6-hydroxyphenyl methylase/3-demethylubiquinone-9 3-methyltransferase
MNELLKQETHFAFGKNWLDYAQKIDEPKIAQAMADLQRLNNDERLDGKTFLDIGCGSGLHALAAIRLGAKRVSCVDIDPDSVQATKNTLAKFAPDTPAQVNVVSVFDMTPEQYGSYDVVYSWGVLHHTGDMYQAIRKAAALVAPGGIFMIALYKKTPFCGMWRVIKKRYTSSDAVGQKRMMDAYLALKHGTQRLRGIDYQSNIRDYAKKRGMNYYNDVHDWLGGYPYESIAPSECAQLFAELDFSLLGAKIQPMPRGRGLFGSGCDEFTFERAP